MDRDGCVCHKVSQEGTKGMLQESNSVGWWDFECWGGSRPGVERWGEGAMRFLLQVDGHIDKIKETAYQVSGYLSRFIVMTRNGRAGHACSVYTQ